MSAAECERRLERARALLEVGRAEDAYREARLALAAEPNSIEGLVVAAHALVALERPEEAVGAASAALAADPEDLTAHVALAEALDAAGRGEEAVGVLDDVIAMAPWIADAHVMKAVCLIGVGESERALESAHCALELDPEHAGAARALAAASLLLGHHAPAAAAAQDALALEPDDASSHSVAGAAALFRGDARRAVEHYQEALRLEPANDAHRMGLAEALKSRNPVYALLFRLARWQERQTDVVQGLVTFFPLFAVVFLRVTRLRDTSAGTGALVLVGAVLALFWAIEPVTNAVLLARPVGRLVLDRAQRRSALHFSACLGAASLCASLAAVAAQPVPALVAAGGLAVLALGLGTSHNVTNTALVPVLHLGAAGLGACAAVAAVCAVLGAGPAGIAVLVLVGGIGSLWFVRLA